MKLHQLLAVIKTAKANSDRGRTDVYHLIQNKSGFAGLSRTYQPIQDGDVVYPSESKMVQQVVGSLIEQFTYASIDFMNLAAAQDWANTQAIADIVVDGQTILSNVPVTHLLCLEDQLKELKTFISKLPALDVDKDWHFDGNRGVYVTEPKQTIKTKAIAKPVVLYEATKEHPAQVEKVTEQIPEGVWTVIEMSGALPKSRIDELMVRVEKLIVAVILAREEANNIEIQKKQVAESIFQYLFA